MYSIMDGISGGISSCHVVAMPYPGRGHINPMMNLCKLLVTKANVTITFVVTEEWLSFIDSPTKPETITLRSIPNVIPSELIRAANYVEFLEAVRTKMEYPFEQLLGQLEMPVTAIISAASLPWAVAVGNRKNIPVVGLWPISPSVFSFYYYFDLIAQNGHFPVDLSERGDEVIDYIPGISSTRLADLPSIFYGQAQKFLCVMDSIYWMKKAQCLIFTSFYELEPQVMDSLRATLPFPVYTLGPLIPHTTLNATPSISSHNINMEYFKWLDSQQENSVLYISLGSFLSVSREQMDEIIQGVRASGVRYFWVSRGEDDTSSAQEACTGEMGLVVPWCDQLRVLCHSSVGGFLTHCGWNSTLEGVFAGVPMLTFPINFDQVPNSKLIVDDWKIGMKVKEVAKEKVIARDEIAIIVQRFMNLDGDESKEMRRRASELREACRRALDKGGSSEANVNTFVREILKCN